MIKMNKGLASKGLYVYISMFWLVFTLYLAFLKQT